MEGPDLAYSDMRDDRDRARSEAARDRVLLKQMEARAERAEVAIRELTLDRDRWRQRAEAAEFHQREAV